MVLQGTQGYEAPEIRGYVSSTLDGEDSDDESSCISLTASSPHLSRTE